MKKTEIIERLTALQEILNMDAKDMAAKYNAEHPDGGYTMKPGDAYPYMVGWAQGEINWILSH